MSFLFLLWVSFGSSLSFLLRNPLQMLCLHQLSSSLPQGFPYLSNVLCSSLIPCLNGLFLGLPLCCSLLLLLFSPLLFSSPVGLLSIMSCVAHLSGDTRKGSLTSLKASRSSFTPIMSAVSARSFGPISSTKSSKSTWPPTWDKMKDCV